MNFPYLFHFVDRFCCLLTDIPSLLRLVSTPESTIMPYFFSAKIRSIQPIQQCKSDFILIESFTTVANMISLFTSSS